MHLVYLALGTNLGNRSENLRAAVKNLEPHVRVKSCSPVYETPPWGYEDQPAFLNQVLQVETELSPKDLLDSIKSVEKEIGRQETFLYGPRLIDIDILFYDKLVVDSTPLVIPHPRIQERAFVLIPMADLDPDFVHPVLGASIKSLLGEVDVQGIHEIKPGPCSESDSDLVKFNSAERRQIMTEEGIKPLNWEPTPGIGYTVVRRPDGGMHYTFTDITHETLEHWHAFAVDHLLDSDRLTTNLYDLRQIDEISQEAVDYAIEVNSDPSARNIRLAVVVKNDEVRQAIEKIPSLTTPGGVEFGVFTDLEESETWLDRPLTLIV